ncbi:MAG: ABC transporter substrate-binding protein [Pseudomonadota bacterium]
MRLRVFGGVVAALAALPAAAADLPRIASTTLCGDQYLLALGVREQIASVSWMATGPNSAYADAAEGLPTNRGGLEELLASGADKVLAPRGTDPQMLRVLEAFDMEAVPIPMANDFETVASNLRAVGEAIGRPEAAEAAVAEMEARLAAIAPADGAPRPRALYYRPGGGGAGAGTFVHAVIEAAGMLNHQAERGMTGWAGLPLEALATDPPDGIVTSFFDTSRASARGRLSRSSVFRRATIEKPLVEVPGRLWICGHPKMAEAAEILAAARPRFIAEMAARGADGDGCAEDEASR